MEEDQEEQQLREEFRALVKSPAWGRLSSAADAQIVSRERMILAPSHEKAEVNGKPVSEDYLKGEISGIRSFLLLPTILIENANEVLKSQENVNDDSKSSSTE